MFAQFVAKLAAVGSVAENLSRHRFAALTAAMVGALALGGCLPTRAPLIRADPSDPGAKVAGVGYGSTVAPYAGMRPMAPSSWRERNQRVAPAPKADQ